MTPGSMRKRWRLIILCLSALLSGCGGGGSSSPPPPTPPSAKLTIITDSNLPGTLINAPYTATLQATNGVGALHWSIAPLTSTTLFVDGLTIDPNTGVLSGTANFAGTAGFLATVKDSASNPHTASKGFTVTANSPLQTPPSQAFTVGQFRDVIGLSVGNLRGVQPFTYVLSGGALPFGLRLDSQTGQIRGSATVLGTYPATVTVTDSYSPPEVVTAQITIQVIPPPLSIADSVPRRLSLNRPFSGSIVATGGIPPYHFVKSSGSLPTGLSAIDPNTGQFNGTPDTPGQYFFTVDVSDSSSAPQSTSLGFSINVTDPIGRNDTVATATPIGNGMVTASISPYIDPPSTAPAPADQDYYKLISLSGSVIHTEIQAQRWWPSDPLDSVIEIVDANGSRLTTCRQPGNTTSTFASACINDDISFSPHVLDSALDFKVPGAASTATTFYVHVLDWRGDARPDMTYALQVSGLVAPLAIQATPLLPAARGLSYSQQLIALNGIGNVTWNVTSGGLPLGLALSSSGAITGSATTNGTYSFTVQATDSATPPQTATVQESIQVADPVKITSPAVLPDACVGQPYSFAFQTSGGIPPFQWGLTGYSVGINVDQSTGVFSGVAVTTGTFTSTIGVNDATQHGDALQITLNVVQCGG